MGSAEQAAIVRAYIQTSRKITGNLSALLERYWAALSNFRDADAEQFIARILPLVEGAATQQSALTTAYLERLIADQLGQAIAPSGVRPPTIEQLRGVPAAEVYNRPFATVRAALAEGKPFTEAIQQGLTRLNSITTTNMQLSKRSTARSVLNGNPRVVGYRRVLARSKPCPLCVIASTQRYHKKDLLPIHPGCDCVVAPIVGDRDPGQVINAPLLESTHKAVAEKYGEAAVDRGARSDSYRTADAITVYDHGELGPTLAVRGHRHDGPSAVKAPAKTTSPAQPPTDRRLNAGDLTTDQGQSIAAAARRLAAGEISDAEYRRLVRSITNTDSRGHLRS